MKDEQISEYSDVTWKELEIFNRQGLNVHPGTFEITGYLCNLFSGFHPLSLQDLCARTIVLNDRHLEDFLPKPLKKVCEEYLSNIFTAQFIRWDLTIILFRHTYWHIQ